MLVVGAGCGTDVLLALRPCASPREAAQHLAAGTPAESSPDPAMRIERQAAPVRHLQRLRQQGRHSCGIRAERIRRAARGRSPPTAGPARASPADVRPLNQRVLRQTNVTTGNRVKGEVR